MSAHRFRQIGRRSIPFLFGQLIENSSSGAPGPTATGQAFSFEGCFPQLFVYPGLGSNYTTQTTITTTYTATSYIPTSRPSTYTTTRTFTVSQLGQALGCILGVPCTTVATGTTYVPATATSSYLTTQTVTTGVTPANYGAIAPTPGVFPNGWVARFGGATFTTPADQQCANLCAASQSNYFATQSNFTAGFFATDCYCGFNLYITNLIATTAGTLLQANCPTCPDGVGSCGDVSVNAIAVYAKSF